MSHPTFTLVRKARIPSLNIEVEEYRHLATGACHLHLAADDDNNVFLVAFLTVPKDSTGVAHILEHTALCGSKRYPVRDPFFLMTRRSLNTFMNAFTSSDWTAYPFASKNTKDFDNLLQVYLDAAFFPNLEELDFAQEGHRLEFATPNDANTPLVYKGVVFNEMKGAMSSPVQRLVKEVYHNLFPTITYHHNSGGEPKDIPNLTHAQLKAFHANHYHPSNAIFMTYGDQPVTEHQRRFEEYALQHFQKLELNLQIPNEQRYTTPQSVLTYYPIDKPEDNQNKTHVVLAWLLGDSTDIKEVMNANLLAGVLLENSASPLRQALETTTLGTAPSPLCGVDDSTREGSFMCGLEGSNPDQAEAVEALILLVLDNIANKGVPAEQVESVLHQIELSQREITGGGLPYGLQLLANVLSPVIHGGDPVQFLDIDSALTTLRADCQDTNFVPNLVRRLLLQNQHRVRLVMAPDANLLARQVAEETAQLKTLQAAINAEDKTRIIDQTVALEARQQHKDNPDILPKVGLDDVPADLKIPQGTKQAVKNLPATWFARGTNGMVYQKMVVDLPNFAPQLLDILPLFCSCMTEVGYGKKNYQEAVAYQSAVTGGIYSRTSLRGNIDNVQMMRGVFTLSGKALVRNQAALAELLRETLEQVHFDELPRLRELIAQLRAGSENSITSRGHALAMTAASSGVSPSGFLYHRWHGLKGLQRLKALDDSLATEDKLAEFASNLESIKNQLLAMPRQLLVVSEAEQHDNIATALEACWPDGFIKTEDKHFNPSPIAETIKQAWSVNTQINFCAKAYPTIPINHSDAPALTVLGKFLHNGYLHSAVREQGGAYGSGANYDGDTGAFRFFSYRDPRLIDTLADFDAALLWLLDTKHKPRALEEAILGIISQIDRPGSPAGEATSSFFNSLYGRSPEWRRQFRQQILQVKSADLQRVASTYLQASRSNVAVLSNAETLASLPELELERMIL